MRIVIDMQGAQTESRFGGIGRYTLSLARAIVRNRGEHEILLALSGYFPDTIEPIRAAFDDLLPQENIRVWYAPGPIRECDAGNEWRREVAERIREAFLVSLKPDIVHVTSKFEGYVDDAVTSIGVYAPQIPTVVTLYSLNPLVRADTNHKQSPVYERFLHRNIESLKRAQGWIQLVDHPIQHVDEGVVPFLKRVVGVSTWNKESPACSDITVALQCVYSPDSDEVQVNPTWAQNARKAIALFEELRAPVAENLQSYDCVQALIESTRAIERFGANDQDVLLTASAIAANHPENRQKILYVDISHLVQKDLKTGIQRVTRSVVAALINNPPADYQIKPVFATRASHGYLHANCYAQQLAGVLGVKQIDDPIDPQVGDIFLGLDFAAGIVTAQQHYLKWMHNHGVRMYFVIYDLLLTKLPHCFPEGAEAGHRQWLQTIAQFDGAICISRAVKDDLDAWLRTSASQRHRPFETGWFHLGADLENSLPTWGIPKDAEAVINKLAALPSFLMVGTVEPRKGHTQTLQAFELLWEQGAQVNLVIVGNRGWMVEELSKQLHKHPELNNRLFWLQGTSDEYLERIYAASTCLIAASEGEGFGLPLIEAAKHKLPIIARDIPVFREIAGEHAHYFSGCVPENLAQAIETWITFDAQGCVPQSKDMPWITWKESVANLMDTILLSNK
jgi:glycosyltransferase involved in cell wall biosynthesis